MPAQRSASPCRLGLGIAPPFEVHNPWETKENMDSGQTPTTREQGSSSFFKRPPVAVFVLAVLAAVLHLMPVWRSQIQTPPDWTFTGNTSISPDYMQYRTWSRQSQETGILVDNRFTSEPNSPYLPVVYYWGIGQIAESLDVQPEFVFEYVGAVLAFFLVILLFLCVRLFLPKPYQTWWVFMALLFGGGLTSHPVLLQRLHLMPGSWFISSVVTGMQESLTFDKVRFAIPFRVLFDPHFLIVWLALIGALFMLYAVLQRRSNGRYLGLALLCGGTTFLHVYQGLILIAVGTAVTGLWWVKTRRTRECAAAWILTVGPSLAVLFWIRVLYLSSGLPYPTWRAPDVLFSNFVLAYPIALGLIVWGVARYWRGAGLQQVFLLGWVLGCTALVLSSPYYAYADRGATALQVPLFLAAGQIFFGRWSRVSWRQAAIAIFVLAAFPVVRTWHEWSASAFSPAAPWTWLDAAHEETLATLKRTAGGDDILLADYSDYRWLAPENPGRSYHAHFFLTVDFEAKRERADQFFRGDPAEQWGFLEEEGIRFVLINSDNGPERFQQVAGLESISEGAHGTLFEVVGRQASGTNTGG